jgi:UDP-N-acetylmuramate dehydrogenase
MTSTILDSKQFAHLDAITRGRLQHHVELAPYTWFRVGGPADFFFVPEDEDDLSVFLENLPEHVPVHVMGLASNTLFRDKGVEGVVIRLGRGFANIETSFDHSITAGAAVPDMKLAKAAAEAGIGGLSFYRGIPGAIGGALRMNAGAHGGQTSDTLHSVRAMTRAGDIITLSADEMGHSYRNSTAPADLIFLSATYKGTPEKPEELKKQMDEVVAYREEHQPTREKTGGSTFKNPPGHSSWKLIDEAGCRGLTMGGAQMSEKHCNFMINTGTATATDLETLGEMVRDKVFKNSGIQLEWEIKRVGRL